ncbi:Hypothetical_protein [Hexamita inflata]|uniref:Hypothetical_protein n=1 Tax=Hexamita inflata TaxID=28002 RepID=A0AA86NF29_9EUKA|nr:Hypothetical protein HINF_LOCUS5788 [Hexamita inflata]
MELEQSIRNVSPALHHDTIILKPIGNLALIPQLVVSPLIIAPLNQEYLAEFSQQQLLERLNNQKLHLQTQFNELKNFFFPPVFFEKDQMDEIDAQIQAKVAEKTNIYQFVRTENQKEKNVPKYFDPIQRRVSKFGLTRGE